MRIHSNEETRLPSHLQLWDSKHTQQLIKDSVPNRLLSIHIGHLHLTGRPGGDFKQSEMSNLKVFLSSLSGAARGVTF